MAELSLDQRINIVRARRQRNRWILAAAREIGANVETLTRYAALHDRTMDALCVERDGLRMAG